MNTTAVMTMPRLLVLGFLLLLPSITPAADTVSAPADQAAVQFINQQSIRCMAGIKAELVGLSNKCPALKNIAAEPVDAAKATTKNAGCSMNFWHKMHVVNGKESLEDDGIRLAVGIREHMPNLPVTQRFKASVGKKRVSAYYHIEVGKNLKDVEGSIKMIVERNLQHFCALAEKVK